MKNQHKIVLEPTTTARFSVIWLHGLGADASDFVPVANELGLPEELAVRFVFPNAPVMPVTVNGGYQMRAWYDIKTMDLLSEIDLAGIDASVQLLNELIAEENNQGVATDRIILAGFSQGGVIALATALRAQTKPLAVMALSTYLAEKNMAEAGQFDVFQAHGTVDDVIPLSAAAESRNYLQSLGLDVEWHEYLMAHSVNEQEIKDIRQWLLRQFKKVG